MAPPYYHFKIGQFLLFKKSTAKITRFTTTHVIMRKCSIGGSGRPYTWQHKCTIEHLQKMHKERKVGVISPELILHKLTREYKGAFPIDKPREWLA